MVSAGAATTQGLVFDIKRYATDDGPGIRTTIFLKGCPLRCLWCHNPEGQCPHPELMYRKRKCTRCSECVTTCTAGALALQREKLSIDRKLCSLCGKCSEKCPTDAMRIAGKEMSVTEVLREIEKDRMFFDESEGGVTFSGGEPLMQVNFLHRLLEECKKKSIHTAVDTCGYASRKAFAKIIDKVDIFLYDIKTMEEATHKKYTGVSNVLVLENLTMLAERGSKILARVPIIPNINDGEENTVKTAEFLSKLDIEKVHILPYHRAGIEKYRSLGRTYKLGRIESPSDQKLNSIRKRLETFGLRVKIGGG